MTAFSVVVRAGRDYYAPPESGDQGNLTPADALTNPGSWVAAGNGYDDTQPAPVPSALGMDLTWTTDAGKSALQGVWVAVEAGHSYTLSVTVRAADGAASWRAAVGWAATSGWSAPDGYDQIRTLSWTAQNSGNILFGVETSGPNADTHSVLAIGVWDHDDETIQWNPRELDRCDVALPLQVTHGRSGVGTQPDAPVCTFTFLGEQAPTSLGDSIEVEVAGVEGGKWTDPTVFWTDPTVSWVGTKGRSLRFRGYITALRAVESEGRVVAWDVVATGGQARLGRVPIKITRPQETDVERVEAIAAEAGVAVTIIGSPGPTLIQDNIDRDALSALHEVCASSGGLLWQDRDGSMVYGTASRLDDVPEWRWSCELILDGVEWYQTTAEIVNHVTVEWGPEDTPPQSHGRSTQDTYRDDASIAKWGYRHVDVSTRCASAADAATLAAAILARRAQPRWVMPGVVALRDKATPSQWAQVMPVEVADTVLVDVQTTPTPTPGAATPWTVEGWVETWESAGRRIQFALSEHRLGSPISWDQSAVDTWDHWATTTSWLTAMVEV